MIARLCPRIMSLDRRLPHGDTARFASDLAVGIMNNFLRHCRRLGVVALLRAFLCFCMCNTAAVADTSVTVTAHHWSCTSGSIDTNTVPVSDEELTRMRVEAIKSRKWSVQQADNGGNETPLDSEFAREIETRGNSAPADLTRSHHWQMQLRDVHNGAAALSRQSWFIGGLGGCNVSVDLPGPTPIAVEPAGVMNDSLLCRVEDSGRSWLTYWPWLCIEISRFVQCSGGIGYTQQWADHSLLSDFAALQVVKRHASDVYAEAIASAGCSGKRRFDVLDVECDLLPLAQERDSSIVLILKPHSSIDDGASRVYWRLKVENGRIVAGGPPPSDGERGHALRDSSG